MTMVISEIQLFVRTYGWDGVNMVNKQLCLFTLCVPCSWEKD